MNSSFKCLTYVGTALALLATSLSFPFPARASLPCHTGTISSYRNGSISSCLLEADVDINTGGFNFSCQKNQFISFDDKAHLTSCILTTSLMVRKNSEIETCPAKSRVEVSFLPNGNQVISCQSL